MSDILIQTRPSPKGEGHGFCIVIVQVPVEGPAAAHSILLQDGYASEAQALDALYQCLTFAPPDLTVYDETLAQVSGALDRLTALEEAMTQVGDRLNTLEEFRESFDSPAAPAGGSGLLRPRVPAPGPRQPVAPRQPAPSIRQPARPAAQITIGMQSSGKAGPGMAIAGGAFRPGQGGDPPDQEG